MSNISIGLTKNPRITADELAVKSGFDVYVPDLFDGEPVHSTLLKDIPQSPGHKTSVASKVNYPHKNLFFECHYLYFS